MHQLDTSLGRLRTDHVDLWLAHTWSDDVPLEETLSALEWAVATGRARYVGVSNYAAGRSPERSRWNRRESFGGQRNPVLTRGEGAGARGPSRR